MSSAVPISTGSRLAHMSRSGARAGPALPNSCQVERMGLGLASRMEYTTEAFFSPLHNWASNLNVLGLGNISVIDSKSSLFLSFYAHYQQPPYATP
ncbi:unnamed protein product [Nezara viridula]|uniref:Uncharacterized protein n=1 Tax=Nezara viridula TaxID=85310 RepID=A0A9P0E4Z3_NEZVI|nr:unnamed protein product [Nezara viridula]